MKEPAKVSEAIRSTSRAEVAVTFSFEKKGLFKGMRADEGCNIIT
jgi:hypothetical protein